ncbi:MAG: flagellar basal body L-ring protein FlgH [Planctomycetota bacterium]
MTPRFAITLAIALTASAAQGQSLFNQSFAVSVNESTGEPDLDREVRSRSLMHIDVPEPPVFEVHDLVTIIIDEVSRAESFQSIETEKEFDIQAAVNAFPSLRDLLELQLENGDSQRGASVDIRAGTETTNDGEFEQGSRFTARITAEVIDVKPNGNLVLEARKTISNADGELQEIVLSGVCRQEDVTLDNTIGSSSLADLRLFQRTEGEVAKAGSKGIISRVLDAIFNF